MLFVAYVAGIAMAMDVEECSVNCRGELTRKSSCVRLKVGDAKVPVSLRGGDAQIKRGAGENLPRVESAGGRACTFCSAYSTARFARVNAMSA